MPTSMVHSLHILVIICEGKTDDWLKEKTKKTKKKKIVDQYLHKSRRPYSKSGC